MESAIVAIGVANPRHQYRQMDIAEFITAGLPEKSAEKRLIKSVYKAAGIDFRYSVLDQRDEASGCHHFFSGDAAIPTPGTAARMKIYHDHALTLALTAIRNCFASLDHFDAGTITHVITVSCTGMYAPGIDIEIVQKLQLNSTIKRTAINFMGCYGAFNGIKVANDICLANPAAVVLLVCVELCTIHFQNNRNMDNIVANAIFADGAAAVVIQANSSYDKYFNLVDFHCNLMPQTSKDMAWKISDYGFDIVLSSYVPDVIQAGISEFVDDLLGRNALVKSDINFFAIHPGGLKILRACEQSLAISCDDNQYSYQVLKSFGNMSSATILFVLKGIWDDLDDDGHGKNIFSCAFGPGLTLESMLLQTHIRVPRDTRK